MQIRYSPQRSDSVITYSFDGETITATVDGESEVFDLSTIPDGEAIRVESTLDPRPVLSARRVDGVLHVTLLRAIGPRPADESELQSWLQSWTDIDG